MGVVPTMRPCSHRCTDWGRPNDGRLPPPSAARLRFFSPFAWQHVLVQCGPSGSVGYNTLCPSRARTRKCTRKAGIGHWSDTSEATHHPPELLELHRQEHRGVDNAGVSDDNAIVDLNDTPTRYSRIHHVPETACVKVGTDADESLLAVIRGVPIQCERRSKRGQRLDAPETRSCQETRGLEGHK